jgi:hypothetical protein
MLLARNMLEKRGFIASGPILSTNMQRVPSNGIALDGNLWRDNKHSSLSVCWLSFC